MPPDDVHRIPLPTPFQIGDVNTWLLRGSPLTLVDAGPHERPGHSPTDTVLAGEGLLLAGDHLLERISSNPIAHAPIAASDPAALATSPERPRTLLSYVESLRATAAADGGELVLPGHGEPFHGIAELVTRRASMHERRAGKILASLTHPRSAADIGRDLWRHVPVTQAYLVLSEVLGHLDLLESRGAVSASEHDGVVLYSPASREVP